jgi:hypothetical protein
VWCVVPGTRSSIVISTTCLNQDCFCLLLAVAHQRGYHKSVIVNRSLLLKGLPQPTAALNRDSKYVVHLFFGYLECVRDLTNARKNNLEFAFLMGTTRTTSWQQPLFNDFFGSRCSKMRQILSNRLEIWERPSVLRVQFSYTFMEYPEYLSTSTRYFNCMCVYSI